MSEQRRYYPETQCTQVCHVTEDLKGRARLFSGSDWQRGGLKGVISYAQGLAITLSLAPSMEHGAAVASREQCPAALRSPLGIHCWVESWFEGGQLRREAVASSGNLCFWKAARRREGSSSTKQCVKNPGTYKTQNKEDIPDPDCVRHGCKDSLPDYIRVFF